MKMLSNHIEHRYLICFLSYMNNWSFVQPVEHMSRRGSEKKT